METTKGSILIKDVNIVTFDEEDIKAIKRLDRIFGDLLLKTEEGIKHADPNMKEPIILSKERILNVYDALAEITRAEYGIKPGVSYLLK